MSKCEVVVSHAARHSQGNSATNHASGVRSPPSASHTLVTFPQYPSRSAATWQHQHIIIAVMHSVVYIAPWPHYCTWHHGHTTAPFLYGVIIFLFLFAFLLFFRMLDLRARIVPQPHVGGIRMACKIAHMAQMETCPYGGMREACPGNCRMREDPQGTGCCRAHPGYKQGTCSYLLSKFLGIPLLAPLFHCLDLLLVVNEFVLDLQGGQDMYDARWMSSASVSHTCLRVSTVCLMGPPWPCVYLSCTSLRNNPLVVGISPQQTPVAARWQWLLPSLHRDCRT